MESMLMLLFQPTNKFLLEDERQLRLRM
ncbi:hypothetical protein LINGRAPRIM_LOCUS3027 [Linum grandiflorum]